MRTIQDIIDNQEEYKNEIYLWFKEDLAKTRALLKSIKGNSEFIQKEKEKLQKKLKRAKFKLYLDKLFFMHSQRNKEYYVWWDKESKEALIVKYEKR